MAEALRMAAGVLLAVLLISIIVFVFRSINEVEDNKQTQIVVTQINEFNSTFNAYNKSQMYGTDVMSILSLAINNNRDLNGERMIRANGDFKKDVEGSINIRVKLSKQDKIKIRKYRIITEIQSYTRDDQPIINEKREDVNAPIDYFNGCQRQGDYLTLEDMTTVNRFQDMIVSGDKKVELIEHKEENYGTKVTNVYQDSYGIDDFKKCIFTCADVKYRPNGQIYEMTFEEIPQE
jgi:hypothetical protein